MNLFQKHLKHSKKGTTILRFQNYDSFNMILINMLDCNVETWNMKFCIEKTKISKNCREDRVEKMKPVILRNKFIHVLMQMCGGKNSNLLTIKVNKRSVE